MKSYFVEAQIPQARQSTALPKICTSPHHYSRPYPVGNAYYIIYPEIKCYIHISLSREG